MGSGKHRWKKIFQRSSLLSSITPSRKLTPEEFVCPISGSLMADPAIVSSGHTFERNCVLACKSLAFQPTLPDGSIPDFSTVIPNIALKSTILNWCLSSFIDPPTPIDFQSALSLVHALMSSQNAKSSPRHHNNNSQYQCPNYSFKELKDKTELTLQPNQLSSSSEESVVASPARPLALFNPSSCCSSSPDLETPSSNSTPEDELVAKLKSSQVSEQEEAVASLRKLTRTQAHTRLHLCTPRLLSALRSLITSRHASVQADAVAALVNLSLENQNKVNIVRSGIVPSLIDVLRGRSSEAKDHAAGALFSLAVDDQNKTAIGVLGALPPLLDALRSDSERTRHDSALALYHLSLVESNRAKLVKLMSVQFFLEMVRSGHMTGRILLVLRNLAASTEGRAAMLDEGAVECFVRMLSREEFKSRESCVAALHGLSYGGLRFKGLAREAGAEEVLRKLEEMGSERVKGKARRILEVVTREDEEEEVVDWEELLNSRKMSSPR